MSQMRQKLLFLYLANSELTAGTIAWVLYDGTSDTNPPIEPVDAEPPYPNALAAMRDGWRVIQLPELRPPYPGREYETSYLKFEVVLEKLEPRHG